MAKPVIVTATRAVPVVPPPSEVVISLDPADATVLRTMLGGLKRDERRAAVQANGGDKEMADRARHLVKEIIDAMSAQGINPPGGEPADSLPSDLDYSGQGEASAVDEEDEDDDLAF